jgi:hypothetical protein
VVPGPNSYALRRAKATNLLRGSVTDVRLRVVEFGGVWHRCVTEPRGLRARVSHLPDHGASSTHPPTTVTFRLRGQAGTPETCARATPGGAAADPALRRDTIARRGSALPHERRSPSGNDAMEIAFRLARVATGRFRRVSFRTPTTGRNRGVERRWGACRMTALPRRPVSGIAVTLVHGGVCQCSPNPP